MAELERAVERARKEGNYFFKQKQYEAALGAYKKGLEVDKGNVLLLSNIAQVYLTMEKYVEAEAVAGLAVRLDPTWHKCYNRAAVAAENIGQLAKARDYLKKGVQVLECLDASKRLETSSELDHFKRELRRLEEKLRNEKTAITEPCGLIYDSDNEDSEEDYDSDTHSVSSVKSTCSGRESVSRSDSLGRVTVSKKITYSGSNADRSRSSSVPPAAIIATLSVKKITDMPPPKSTFTTSAKGRKKNKKKTGPIQLEELEADPFIAFLSNASLVPDDKVKREKFFQMKKEEIKTLLKEGSQALEAGVYTAAVEKFKTVYDYLLEFPYQDVGLKEMDVVVVKYLLCFSWVSLTIYEDIVKAIEILQDMESTYSSKFPAIYYSLGLAFFKLNRFKSAAVYVEKGLEFVRKNLRLCAYPYPGTVSKPIRETTPESFEPMLSELLKNCRTHYQPNAVCRHENCHKLRQHQHIEPSELIFYNDPDFNGFIVIICEEKCRIEYHVHCWKNFKESSSIKKVADKDMLGQNCPTKDCVTKTNQHSVIVRIEVIGENGAIKTSVDATRNEELVKDARKNRRKHVNSESLPDKKQHPCRARSKEKEYETLKEQRRQEKYRKSELEREVSTDRQKLTNKNKPDEKQKLLKSQKELHNDDYPNNSNNLKILEHEGIKIITVYNSSEESVPVEVVKTEDTKMLKESELGIPCAVNEMACDPVYGNDNEGDEDKEVNGAAVNIHINLHDDCFADFDEDMLVEIFGSSWTELRETENNTPSLLCDPRKAFFGREVLKSGSRFLPESQIEGPEDEVKEFICSYMYEFLRSADSQSIQDVNDKWMEDSDELKIDLTRVKMYEPEISDLLLASSFFAALDEHFGLAEFVPVMYDMLKGELHESYDFIFSQNEDQDNVDIYNSQDDLTLDEKEVTDTHEFKVLPVEAGVENSSVPQVMDIQNDTIFPSSFNTRKWSTEDGVSQIDSQWDANTIVRNWSTNDGQSESTNDIAQTELLSKKLKLSLSAKTIAALTELLAPFSEDRQTIWTGMLKWTTSDSKSHAVSCSVMCGSKEKCVKLSGSLWPQEITMHLVSRDFVEAVGFGSLCQLSEIVTLELAVGEESNLLSQDLGSDFAGVIVIGTSPDITIFVVIYFQNTHTFIGLVPQKCLNILCSMLVGICHQQGQNVLAEKAEASVQTDGEDLEMKLITIGEENEKRKLECDEQKERITTLTSTCTSLESQNTSLQLQLAAKEKLCTELSDVCSQQKIDNSSLLEKIRGLEKKQQELCNKLHEQGEIAKDLKSKGLELEKENQDLEKRLSETTEKWSEDKDQIKIVLKKNELSEKLFNKKVEAVEQTNRTLREELKAKENEFKKQINTLTEENISQNEELIQLHEKIAALERNNYELETLNDKLKTEGGKYKDQHHTHLEEIWNCKLEAVNRFAKMITEFCRVRIDEFICLNTAVASSGNAALQNEVDGWIKIWQSCLKEVVLQLDAIKETYPGLLEKVKFGEMVSFPEFSVNLPSQPQNIVNVLLMANKKTPLLPTPATLVSGNPVYYPPFSNTQSYTSQTSGFTQMPRVSLVTPQRYGQVSAYPGSLIRASEPVPDHSSSVGGPKVSFSAQRMAGSRNAIQGLDPAMGELMKATDLLADKISPAQAQNKVKHTNGVESPSLAEANSVEQQEERGNTASRLKKTVLQQSLPSNSESSSSESSDITTSNTIIDSQTLMKKVPASVAATPKETKPVVTQVLPAASKSLVTSAGDANNPIPATAKPFVFTAPVVGAPAAPTTLSTKPTRAPVKTAAAQPPSFVDTSVTPIVKPPSLLDIPTKMPTTQTGKLQQNQKPKNANFQKLLTELRKKFPNKADDELEACILVVRERNNNRLTGLPLPTIITSVGKVLQEQARKKDGGSMGLDKFGTTAWHLKSSETVQWSKPIDTSEEECTICIEPLGTQTTTLYCKHSFHTSCIRKWLRNESVCPICRVYTRMADEFPPLA